MNITIIQGSPHKNGASNLLADQFKRGAELAGHHVSVFDAAHAQIAPCQACEYCHTTGGGTCILNDDMRKLRERILDSDMVVFATPLYFFNMSAQMQTVIDRFYAFLDKLSTRVRQTALLVTANNPNPHITDIVANNYLSIVHFLGAKAAGMILACGCGTPKATRNSDYPTQAYAFGATLKEV